jgi:acyl-coenzyme A synthetase/AMP-(fatty) acid ligase
MPQADRISLSQVLSRGGEWQQFWLSGPNLTFPIADLQSASSLDQSRAGLRGSSVLVATTDQFVTALVLIELDGVARRILLCPPDVSVPHLHSLVPIAEVDTIVTDRVDLMAEKLNAKYVRCTGQPEPGRYDRRAEFATEWILLTSGTTGRPKLVVHSLYSLSGAIGDRSSDASTVVWGTFYDIRRYGGLQIFLRAILTGSSLVLSGSGEPVAQFLNRAGYHGVTHISGTPSHWRRALMSPAASCIEPRYVRLSGEIADQTVLDHLRTSYAQAEVAHAFASTEAGVAFDVRDGLAGFPAALIGHHPGDVTLKVKEGTLRIRSPRTAARYLGEGIEVIGDEEGFVDTGDLLELRGNRYYFVGRRDGVINVGGLKVHPEEVEDVLNRHPLVRMSRVRSRSNPISGSLVIAEIVLKAQDATGDLGPEILKFCRQALPVHKVPASVRFVRELPVGATGKIIRQHA